MNDFTKYINCYEFNGIKNFYDISPLLANISVFEEACYEMASKICQNIKYIDYVCGIDARGFIFGIKIAEIIGVPFYMIRKDGKLPNSTSGTLYEKEEDRLCISNIAYLKDKNVVIIDDSISTGETMNAAKDLINNFEPADVQCFVFLKLKICTDPKIGYLIHENQLAPIKVGLASTNEIKLNAVKNIFNKNFECHALSVSSGVPEQPEGFEEIQNGANFRLNEMLLKYPGYEVAIAIENGIINISGKYFDIACVVIQYSDNITTTWSSMIPIDNKIIIKLSENRTIGNIIHPTFPSDPHLIVTNGVLGRQAILEQALRIAGGKIGILK